MSRPGLFGFDARVRALLALAAALCLLLSGCQGPGTTWSEPLLAAAASLDIHGTAQVLSGQLVVGRGGQ